MPNRTDLLNHLAEKYQLKRYLEIGVQVPALNFDKIKCEYKISVDPDPNAHASFCMTSDKYFSLTNDDLHDYGWAPLFKIKGSYSSYWSTYDLIFIDGLHTAEQVKRDFENALKVLSPNGWIVMHDTNPETEERTMIPRPTKTGTWNGSTWKFATMLSEDPDMFTVDIDHGCTCYRLTTFVQYNDDNETGSHINDCTWGEFDANRKEFLNLISWDEFTKL